MEGKKNWQLKVAGGTCNSDWAVGDKGAPVRSKQTTTHLLT